MSDWNDMSPDERVVAVLTKVCGWRVGVKFTQECLYSPEGEPHFFKPLIDYATVPPILTSATECIEHVGKAVEENGLAWDYSTLHKRATIFEYVQDLNGKSPFAQVSTGNGDLAPALCEAAYLMATEGEEG